jgi:hypothetical protein
LRVPGSVRSGSFLRSRPKSLAIVCVATTISSSSVALYLHI